MQALLQVFNPVPNQGVSLHMAGRLSMGDSSVCCSAHCSSAEAAAWKVSIQGKSGPQLYVFNHVVLINRCSCPLQALSVLEAALCAKVPVADLQRLLLGESQSRGSLGLNFRH